MPGGKIHRPILRFFLGVLRLRLACLAMFVTNWTKGSEHGTMGSMSASDAAPLPRLGEVFFDVRGSSRSMRLSWYADTGVAVFSIWQGGMCTGTFRLPIGDLPRMIEVLQRGPDEPRSRSRSREHSWGSREPAGTGQREVPAGRPTYPDPGGPYP